MIIIIWDRYVGHLGLAIGCNHMIGCGKQGFQFIQVILGIMVVHMA
jgi:hypothetical protein